MKTTNLLGLSLLLTLTAHATDYHVGPGQTLTTLRSVPWASLQPGDSVNIHPKAGGYHESFLLSASGTLAKPIVIRGIPDDATGALPVIDGADATQDPQVANIWANTLHKYGVVLISRTRNQVYGYIPSNIVIERLDIQNAHKTRKFTNYAGVYTNWPQFCAAIYTEMAQNLTVRECELHNSGLGYYANSKYGNAGLSSNIVVDGCWVHDNGNVGSYAEHNLYIESAATTVQRSLIGPVAAGSFGEDFKDRSAGTIVRFNQFILGGGRGGQGIWFEQAQGGAGVIDKMPTYTNTWVYGNVFYNAPGSAGSVMIRYDSGCEDMSLAHKGTLYVYNNTFINHADKFSSGTVTGRYKSTVFMLPSTNEFAGAAAPEVIECWNNIIVNIPQTPGATPTELTLLWSDSGTVNLGTNWLSTTVRAYALPYGSPRFLGSFNGYMNTLQGTNPGLIDIPGGNFHLTSNSPCIDRGNALPSAAVGRYEVTEEYSDTDSIHPRVITGSTIDLGAFEF